LHQIDDLVQVVNSKVNAEKDPTKAYVGLEHMQSHGSALIGWGAAKDSVSTNSVFAAGDVLFGKLRPNLRKSVLAPFDGYCSTDILVLRAREGVDPRFAARLFQSEKVNAVAEATAIGTKMPRTSWRDLRSTKVFCPLKTEQSKVADVIDVLDIAIRETEAIIEKLKQVKQGLLHDLLTRGIDENGELRPPQSEVPHLYKQSPLGWIPKSWKAVHLRDCLEHAPRNGLYKPPASIGSGALLIGQTAFTRDGSIDLSRARRANISAKELDYFGLRQNDLLVTRVFATPTGVGLPYMVPTLPEAAVYESNMMRLRASEHVVAPKLLFMWLRSQRIRGTITSVVSSSNQSSINQRTLGSIRIGLQPQREQEVTRRLIEKIELNENLSLRRHDALSKVRIGLTDDLLTGRVRVTPLLEE
jgi:type I restriction enzyme, S subunit